MGLAVTDAGTVQPHTGWLRLEDLTYVEHELLTQVEFGGEVDALQRDGTPGELRAGALFQILTGAGGLGPGYFRGLHLSNAAVVGQLDLSNSRLRGHVVFSDCRFDQRVLLEKAKTLTLTMRGCELVGGLGADGIDVDGDVLLSGSRTATPGENQDGLAAVDMDGASIAGDLFCREGFHAHGQVRLLGTQISGQVNLDGGTFRNPDGDALSMDGASIAGDLFCREGFHAHGEVRLPGATIGGQVNLDGGTFRNPDGDALNMEGTTIGEGLHLAPTETAGEVNLTYAQARVLIMHSPTTAPPAFLIGFTYVQVHPGPEQVPVKSRLEWLEEDPAGYAPGPYAVLAAAYEAAGHEDEARKVHIASQNARYRYARSDGPRLVRWPAASWGWLKKVTVGYGYRPGLALLWLVGYFVVGSFLLGLAWDGFVGADGTTPPLYLMDQMLPFLDLAQNKDVTPTGRAAWLVVGLVGIGWVLVTAVIAGVTGALTRRG